MNSMTNWIGKKYTTTSQKQKKSAKVGPCNSNQIESVFIFLDSFTTTNKHHIYKHSVFTRANSSLFLCYKILKKNLI